MNWLIGVANAVITAGFTLAILHGFGWWGLLLLAPMWLAWGFLCGCIGQLWKEIHGG